MLLGFIEEMYRGLLIIQFTEINYSICSRYFSKLHRIKRSCYSEELGAAW